MRPNLSVFRRPLSPSLSNHPVGDFRSDAALFPKLLWADLVLLLSDHIRSQLPPKSQPSRDIFCHSHIISLAFSTRAVSFLHFFIAAFLLLQFGVVLCRSPFLFTQLSVLAIYLLSGYNLNSLIIHNSNAAAKWV